MPRLAAVIKPNAAEVLIKATGVIYLYVRNLLMSDLP